MHHGRLLQLGACYAGVGQACTCRIIPDHPRRDGSAGLSLDLELKPWRLANTELAYVGGEGGWSPFLASDPNWSLNRL